MKKISDRSTEVFTALALSSLTFIAYFYFSIFPNLQAKVDFQEEKIEQLRIELSGIRQTLETIKLDLKFLVVDAKNR